MPSHIKGLSLSVHGYYRFIPSSKGLPKGSPRPAPVHLGTRNFDEAVQLVLNMKGVRREGRGIKEWAEVYKAEKIRAKSHRRLTVTGVAAALKAFTEFTGNKDVITITRDTAQDFYRSLQSPKRSPATTHRSIRYVRAFFSWMVDRKISAENPFAKMGLKAPSQSKRDKFCTVQQRDLLIKECDRDDLMAVLLLGFYLGLRINEIVNARWEWFTITGAGGFCTVSNLGDDFTTKTGKERQIPLHAKIIKWLNQQPVKEGYILHNDKEKWKSWLRWNPRKPLMELCARCNLPWVTPHTMRHTFGSLHAIAGTAEIKIRRWMGITQLTWDRHYAGLCPSDSDINKI